MSSSAARWRTAPATTVLCLGAGLDTRPYRLALPSALVWIEVDFPATIAYKEEHLQGEVPHCRLERSGVDLADSGARRELLARIAERAGRVPCSPRG